MIEVYFQSFPRIYIGVSDVLSKEKKKRITVSDLKLVKQLGSFSGPVLELKRILSSKRWNSAWIELMPEAFSLRDCQHFLENKVVIKSLCKNKGEFMDATFTFYFYLHCRRKKTAFVEKEY